MSQAIRIKVDPTRPRHCPRLGIHIDLCKIIRIGSGREDAFADMGGEIDLTGRAVAEPERQAIASQDSRLSNPHHDFRLPQWLERPMSSGWWFFELVFPAQGAGLGLGVLGFLDRKNVV